MKNYLQDWGGGWGERPSFYVSWLLQGRLQKVIKYLTSSWSLKIVKPSEQFTKTSKCTIFVAYCQDLYIEHLNNRNICITNFYLSSIQMFDIQWWYEYRTIWQLDNFDYSNIPAFKSFNCVCQTLDLKKCFSTRVPVKPWVPWMPFKDLKDFS